MVLVSKRVDSNQPELGVFTRKLQFESIRVDSNQPGLEAMCECSETYQTARLTIILGKVIN